jgi:hypothetical protein
MFLFKYVELVNGSTIVIIPAKGGCITANRRCEMFMNFLFVRNFSLSFCCELKYLLKYIFNGYVA